jgi:signal transduction histidine kinase/DNA-binding response OmpR family regulator
MDEFKIMNLKHFVIFLYLPLCCIAQSPKKQDVLKSLIAKSKMFYNEGQKDSSYHYAKISYKLAKQLKLDSLQLEIVGVFSYFEPDFKKALSYLAESEQIAIRNKQWHHLEKIYHTRGSLYYFRTKDEIALVHFLKLDSLLQIRKDDIFLAAMTKVNIIDILYETRTPNDTSFFPQMNKNIKDGIQLVEDGLKVNEDSIKFYNAYYLNVPAAILYEKKGYVYAARNKPQKALANYQKALENTNYVNSVFTGNDLRKSLIYNGLGNLFKKLNQQDSALHYYKKELIFINKTNDTLKKAIANYRIAKFYNDNNQPKTALNHLNTSQELMESAYLVREDNKYDMQDILASVHFNLGNFKKAFEASEKARYQLMTIQKEFNKNNISELETKYQTVKKEQEIALLESQNKIIEQKRKSQNNILISILSITIIAGIFFFSLYRNRKKTNTKLKELDKIKSNFFTNISHEFRTPLTLIVTPIDDLLEEDGLSDKKRHQFTIAKQNSERLLELVNQLLELSKIDAGQLKLNIQRGDVLQLIASLTDSFKYHAKQRHITYTTIVAQNGDLVWFDKDAIEKITVNLLSNAIKYTSENGAVTCQAFIKSDTLFIEVKNSGNGLTAYQAQHIFERFYQTNDQNQGTGIGLALVKELVELHKGKIDVLSTPNSETTFKLSLPVDKNSFKNETIIEPSNNETQTQIPLLTSSSIEEDDEFLDNDLPILLIVEDNNDLRQLLKQTFEALYKVIVAPNGAIGLDLALEHIPDLIISDIMMPEKDGITLTKELKNNELSAHIPIILLTAKAEGESHFKGIKTGADDYITKPFNKKLLALKVEKLIESRRKLQLRYSQELILLPKDIAITNLDEQFLERVQLTLDKSLIDPSFNVTEFSEAVGMSRMQLHRKLKALTGLSATEFIRSQRLKLAAQLLKKSDINVSQIGYSVGFNDHAYFSKCFKELYHCTPSVYAKSQ